jgi:hypothetical protein
MSDEKKEIGTKLLEIYDKNTDRLYSVIQFGIAVLALYAVVFGYKSEEISYALKGINLNIILCIISLILSIIFSFMKLLMSGSSKYSMFEKNNGLIQFKNDISEQNKRLFSEIATQDNTFISSILLIFCSIGFGYSYLLTTQPVLQQLNNFAYYLVCALFVLSIFIRFASRIKIKKD